MLQTAKYMTAWALVAWGLLIGLCSFVRADEGWKEGRYLVRFKAGVSAQVSRGLMENAGLRILSHIQEIDVYVAEPLDAQEFEQIGLPSLTNRGDLLYIEPDYEVHAIAAPNDPRYGEQGEYQRLDIERAWDLSRGSRDVLVAVSDTGVALTHPDLAAQIWNNPGEIAGNGKDDDGNGYVDDVHGWDFVESDNDPTDLSKHGTHVAGIIGAEGNNGVGIAGVNWRVSILPVRFLDAKGSGSTSNGIKTLLYAASKGARLINCSWGGGGSSKALRDAIEFAFEHGMLVIAAAGNNGRDTDASPSYPASENLPGIVSVASSASEGGLSSFSNRGAISVDLAAPGSSILSTVLGDGYGRLNGTSMAAPMVTGVGALILSLAPELSVLQLRNAILNAVREREGYAGKLSTSGDLSAELALEQLSEGFQVWPSRLTVKIGETYPFSVYDAWGDVEWSVSDPEVVSINSRGELKALTAGEVEVTARDESGEVASTRWIRVVAAGAGGAPSQGCRRRTVAAAPMTDWEERGAALSMSLPFVAGLWSRRKRFLRG